jgi:hypothetical protein
MRLVRRFRPRREVAKMRLTIAALAAAVAAIILLSSGVSRALEAKAIQMREDFGNEPLYDCYLSYYYYIPCPTYAWFWIWTGWDPGDKIGAWFQVGDVSTGGGGCDPTNCQRIDQFRVLDMAGYGCYSPYGSHYYPGLFTQQFDIYCADENGCPVGPALWTSPPTETCLGWNYIAVSPPLSICRCATVPGPPQSAPRVLITATEVGTAGQYPAWATDNIATPVGRGCSMHDYGCLPALYPRPYSGLYAAMHSGFYGNGSFQYCPPQWFKDQRDSTPGGTRYGYVELAWRIYLTCSGPSATEPSTWGAIKAMYK